MDVAELYKNLDLTSREIALSCVLAFPIAYLDLWKLYLPFRGLDWFPQSMLSLGFAVLFVGLGSILSLFYIPFFPLTENSHKYVGVKVIAILLVFAAASISMFLGGLGFSPQDHFILAYLVFGLLSIIMGGIENYRAYKSQKKRDR